MRTRTIAPLALIFLLAAVGLAILAGPAAANGPGPVPQLVKAYIGTAQFHNVNAAVAAGYGKFVDADGVACIDKPGAGGMGTHYVNGGLLDATVNPATPEALVYETLPGGHLRLVAAEYIVFQQAWAAAGNSIPPSLFGEEFELIAAGNRYGIPAFYELHAWIWKWNPSGLFADWNPRVTCNHAS
jgi:hypothetical protein